MKRIKLSLATAVAICKYNERYVIKIDKDTGKSHGYFLPEEPRETGLDIYFKKYKKEYILQKGKSTGKISLKDIKALKW